LGVERRAGEKLQEIPRPGYQKPEPGAPGDLAYLLNVNPTAVENVRNANGKSLDPQNHNLELIVVGFDPEPFSFFSLVS
jgi:hypothetical protein